MGVDSDTKERLRIQDVWEKNNEEKMWIYEKGSNGSLDKSA
jgi:hypothetical protein